MRAAPVAQRATRCVVPARGSSRAAAAARARRGRPDERSLPASDSPMSGRTKRRDGDELDDRSADDHREARAERRCGCVDADRHGAPFLRKRIADDRHRGGGERGFADTDCDARQEQLNERGRESARGRRRAPQRRADCDQSATRSAVCEPAQRQAHHRVEHAERQAVHEPDLRVVERQVGFDRLDAAGRGSCDRRTRRCR